MTDSNKVATDEQKNWPPATDEQIAWCYEASSLQPDSLFLYAHMVWGLLAKIESDRLALAQKETEIQRLREAVNELLDWVNGERRTSDDRLAEIESMVTSKGVTNE